VFVVQLSSGFSRADRDAVLDGLRAAGIGCSNYFSPIHLQPYIQAMFGTRPGDFPVTEHVAERSIALPFFTALDEARQRFVVDELAEQMSRRSCPPAAEIQRRLG
jgi:perosamine synthetase